MIISIAVVFPFFAFQLTNTMSSTQEEDGTTVILCDPKLSLLVLGVIAIIVAFALRNSSYKHAMKGLFAGGIVTLLLATFNVNNSSLGDIISLIFLCLLIIALIFMQPKCSRASLL
jgi:hypothetical protein